MTAGTLSVTLTPLMLFLALFIPSLATAQPSPRWARFEDGDGKADVIEDIAVDAAANIYVAGWTTNSSNNSDYYIAKYDAVGTRVWHHLYDGGGDDVATSVAVKGAHVVVTGRSESGGGFGADDDIVSFILDTAGTIVPDSANAMRYDHLGGGRDDDARKILFSPGTGPDPLFVSSVHADTALADTFFVAGTHQDTLNQSDDLLLLMYDGSGLLGAASHHRAGHEILAGMEISGDGVYLGATAFDSTGNNATYLTVRYDLRLGFGWEKVYGNNFDDRLLGLAADASGVYVTGSSVSSCGDLDVATVGYAPDGTFLWVNRSFSCASTQVGSGGILIDGNEVISAGYHANGTHYFRIQKSDGTVLRMGNVWDVQSAWIGLVRSYDGNIYAGGHRLFDDLPYAAAHLAKFNPFDQLQWDVQFDGSGVGNPNTIRRMIAGPTDSSIIIAGSVTVAGQEDMMIVKYGVGESMLTDVGGGGGTDAPAGIPQDYALDQNYPNPFNSSTILRYRLPGKSVFTLKIYDLIGREVATLVEGLEGPGIKDVRFEAWNLPSGIYVARLTAGRHTQIRKIVLMK